MVRYNNASVDILEQSATLNDEGDKILSWSKVDTVVGDVQSHTLSEAELSLYGINAKKADVKLFLYKGFNSNIKDGNRAVVTSKYLNGATKTYTIQPINAWERHGECLLVPVENE